MASIMELSLENVTRDGSSMAICNWASNSRLRYTIVTSVISNLMEYTPQLIHQYTNSWPSLEFDPSIADREATDEVVDLDLPSKQEDCVERNLERMVKVRRG